MSCDALNEKYMFDSLFREGVCLRGNNISLRYIILSESKSPSRVGFVIRKSTAQAVFRNLLRRKFKDLFRQYASLCSSSLWILFDVPKGPLSVSVSQLMGNTKNLLNQVTDSMVEVRCTRE